MRYFSSDYHFSHDEPVLDNKGNQVFDENGKPITRGIIGFERTQFKNIQEHDQFMVQLLIKYSLKVKPNDEFYVLGDWGNTDYLYLMDAFPCKTIFVYGNHDSENDYSKFAQHFDEVHRYPFFISKKIVLSHEPVAVYDDTVNVHGHLHGSVLQDNNHYCVSVHVIQYKPVNDKAVMNRFSKLPKYTRRFLWEPYAEDYRFTQPREDIVKDKWGNIDLSATRALWKMIGKKSARDDGSKHV